MAGKQASLQVNNFPVFREQCIGHHVSVEMRKIGVE